MRKVLIVEDSPMVMKVLKHVMSSSDLFEYVYATSFAEAKAACESTEEAFFAGVIDLNLPDAPDGEVVDYSLSQGIPTIVLTGSFDVAKKDKLLAKGIVDYVTKEGRYSYEYALGVLERLVKNQELKVLVVDDSDTARKFISTLLRLQLFQVLEASDGVQAIKVVLENPDVKLLITDFNMPRMDGCELVKNIRLKYEKSALVIVGLSSDGEGALSARFIKNGANDFLRKPFNHEEFFCRINHNVEFLELIESIRDAAHRDDMTGAYNRRYFYECCEKIFIDQNLQASAISLAVLDLDEFHFINEQYGHDVGDKVMVAVVQELNALLERFVFARASGQEFYLLMPGLDNDKATAFVEKVRQILCATAFDIDGHSINVTFSAGVSSITTENVDDIVSVASTSLKRAKEAGGDLVFGDD
ncbi:MAG: response regulator [Agarilytica sp.]